MAIIVDKVQKRKDIALACKTLFIERGIDKLTISEVAKTAGVGKGTIYDYFTNKEDIVFEIINTILLERNEKKQSKLENIVTTKEKLKEFYSFFWSEEDADLRQLYKSFTSISLINPSKEMVEFNKATCDYYYAWFTEILQEGIDTNQIIPEAIDLAMGLYVIGDGIFIKTAVTQDMLDIKKEIEDYVDVLFKIIEVKQ